jgi:hypothetical protein
MVEWTAYKGSEEYENTRKWALDPTAVDGSLWAAFERGYRIRRQDDPRDVKLRAFADSMTPEKREQLIEAAEECHDLVDFHRGTSDGVATVKADSAEVKALEVAGKLLAEIAASLERLTHE